MSGVESHALKKQMIRNMSGSINRSLIFSFTNDEHTRHGNEACYQQPKHFFVPPFPLCSQDSTSNNYNFGMPIIIIFFFKALLHNDISQQLNKYKFVFDIYIIIDSSEDKFPTSLPFYLEEKRMDNRQKPGTKIPALRNAGERISESTIFPCQLTMFQSNFC